MKVRAAFTAILLAGTGLLSACGTSVYSVRVPLADPQAVFEDAPHVTIEDMRSAEERTTRVGGAFSGCQRWYGDDTYQPAKLVYLDRLIAERVPGDAPVRIRLEKFDTVEYCENTASRASAAAVYGASSASGSPIYMAASARAGGDSLHLRLAGDINGVPFDVTRSFDYDGLTYKFTEMPADNTTYREMLRKSMNEIADEIVANAFLAD